MSERTEPYLVDGKVGTGLDLAPFVSTADFTLQVRYAGGHVPPISELDTLAPPALAQVNYGRWIATCPQPRCGGSLFVWVAGPLQFFCSTCANRGIFGKWRTVELPEDWLDIDEVLYARHIVTERNWIPGVTVDDLLKQSLRMADPVPDRFRERAEAAVQADVVAEAEAAILAAEELSRRRDIAE